MASDVNPPRGMRDFLPADKARRDAVMAVIRASFAAYGYREIETPVMEELSRLQSGQGGDNEKLLYKILRRGLPAEPIEPDAAVDLGLRFDLTVPLARFYASHRGELPDVFRSIQIAPVWRAERPQKGRYRQFTQCDIDVLGEPSVLAEVELITATTAAVASLGIEGISVRINDRRVLLALLGACGYEAADQPAALITVDKLDKIGLDGVRAELAEAGTGRPEELIAILDGTGAANGDLDAVLAALPGPAVEAAADLRETRDGLAVAAPEVRLVTDPTLVRGMGYYTGPIFELSHPSFRGSVGGGGRYDGMIGRFAGRDVPACGFSIGFERIVDLVDADRLRSGRRRVAVLYERGVAPGVAVACQRALISDGADVRLVPRTRNLGRLLADLEADGFTERLEVSEATVPPTGSDPAPSTTPLGG